MPRRRPWTISGDRAGIFQVYKVLSNRPLTELRLGIAGLMLYGK
jgi:hypothetical protein